MSIKIKYSKKKIKRSSSNVVVFVNDKFKTNNIKKHLSNAEFLYINDLLKTCDVKKNLFVFEATSKKKIVLISIKNNIKSSDIENLGAEFYVKINTGKNSEYTIISDSIVSKDNTLSHFKG